MKSIFCRWIVRSSHCCILIDWTMTSYHHWSHHAIPSHPSPNFAPRPDHPKSCLFEHVFLIKELTCGNSRNTPSCPGWFFDHLPSKWLLGDMRVFTSLFNIWIPLNKNPTLESFCRCVLFILSTFQVVVWRENGQLAGLNGFIFKEEYRSEWMIFKSHLPRDPFGLEEF